MQEQAKKNADIREYHLEMKRKEMFLQIMCIFILPYKVHDQKSPINFTMVNGICMRYWNSTTSVSQMILLRFKNSVHWKFATQKTIEQIQNLCVDFLQLERRTELTVSFHEQLGTLRIQCFRLFNFFKKISSTSDMNLLEPPKKENGNSDPLALHLNEMSKGEEIHYKIC